MSAGAKENVGKNLVIQASCIGSHVFFSFLCEKEKKSERRGGLMVIALNFRSIGPSSSPAQDTWLCSWPRHFTLIVTLLSQVYKWVPANLLLGGNPAIDYIPSWE